ncbi:hypothetical protein KAFR_0L01500 [Kazachstania africana CBS 2517]|uniref:Proteasome assembly chaperone 1 n=1 Tax=Kazachstania africana (strain ATCC 22294 / BCRC 22015 / CBS 2517 / CECT 1963 / NBRC 1671 / NRRL Y-8276) TaxID=1071382 RepID=H2B2B0_KAZAF|nr:hypothetical protein KAFR_0L01500 [Kazachstania africana CBS 2517]CCF60760.1 hypothetical protein KAFR_0L01500 [Kazachstania africana CBS 2517]
MLFKQWNELVEPRHQLDSPVILKNEESLQESPLPQVEIPSTVNFSDYKKIILTTKVMNPLFPKNLLKMEDLGNIETTLLLTESKMTDDEQNHYSWDFNENFPNEFNPSMESATGNNNFSFKFPIYRISSTDTLLISIDENFLKVSPIFLNLISKKLTSSINNDKSSILLLGASDKISNNIKTVTNKNCSINPPEFITGFIGSLLYELLEIGTDNFECIIVPSEGPIGFEKLSLSTMEELINQFFHELGSQMDFKTYYDECHRNWKLEGSATSTQSGLYI